MTLHEMILTALSLAYGGMSLAYVRERFRQKHENALLDLGTFPCIVLWAGPFVLFWGVRNTLRLVLKKVGIDESGTARWVRAWGMVHAVSVVSAWTYYMIRVRPSGSPILPGFMLLGVLLPLEVFLAVPEKMWSWNPDA